MQSQQSIHSDEKVRTGTRRALMVPQALQLKCIIEAATAATAEGNLSATPQSLNCPSNAFHDTVHRSRRIDGSSSSANSDLAPTPTSEGDRGSTRSPATRRVVRPPQPSTTTTPFSSHLRSVRQRDMDEQNRLNSNLFIRNLAADVEQAELDGVFAACGTILSSAVMRNIHTGESLGTAFVRMSTHEEACEAIETLNGRVIGTRAISVQWAKRHDGAPVGEARKKIMKLFVRNIPMDCTVETLEALFARYGGVRQVTLHKDTAPVEDAAMERLIAFVIYTEEGAAERAATAVHNTKPFASCNGVPVMIKLAEDQARHDRNRGLNGHQFVHNYHHQQQQQQQQRRQQQQVVYESATDDAAATAVFQQSLRLPPSPSNSSHTTTAAVMAGALCNIHGSLYTRPVALQATAPSTTCTAFVPLPQRRQPCTPPSCNVPLDAFPAFATSPTPAAAGAGVTAGMGCHPTTQPHHALCSPLTSPLSFQRTSPLSGRTPDYGFTSAFVEGLQQQQRSGPRTLYTAPQLIMGGGAGVVSGGRSRLQDVPSSRSSPDTNSMDGVVIPNPRSLTLGAQHQRYQQQHQQTLKLSCPRSALGSVRSPCISSEATSAPLSPAAAEVRSVDGLRSPCKYRHNPYSMSSSALVC